MLGAEASRAAAGGGATGGGLAGRVLGGISIGAGITPRSGGRDRVCTLGGGTIVVAPGGGELSGRSREGGIFGSARGPLPVRGNRALFIGGGCVGDGAAGRSGGATLAAAVGSAPLAAPGARKPFAGFGCRRERCASVSSVESVNGPLPLSGGRRVHVAAAVNGSAAALPIGW